LTFTSVFDDEYGEKSYYRDQDDTTDDGKRGSGGLHIQADTAMGPIVHPSCAINAANVDGPTIICKSQRIGTIWDRDTSR